MEKLDKKKVLAVVLIIALIAALAGTVSLLYNSIDMFLHNVSGNASQNSGQTKNYIMWQRPYAIITLFAFLSAALGAGAGIASFVAKKAQAKKLCLSLTLFAAFALLILTVAAAGVNFSNEARYIAGLNADSVYNKEVLYPFGVSGNINYALFSGVMSALLQQLVYAVIIAAALLIVYKSDKRNSNLNAGTVEETGSATTNKINSENKGE